MTKQTGTISPNPKLEKAIQRFELIVVVGLIFVMMIVILLGALDLAWLIIKDIISPPFMLLDVAELLNIFGFFLLILIGMELLEMLRAYLRHNVVHVEIVLVVALVAMARKVIVLDLTKYDSMTIFAVAAVILALSVGYLLVRQARMGAALLEKQAADVPNKTRAEDV